MLKIFGLAIDDNSSLSKSAAVRKKYLTHLRESLQRVKFEQMTIGPVVVTGGHDERMTGLVELRQNLLVAFVRTRHRNSSGIALVWARVGHEITNMDDECEILLVFIAAIMRLNSSSDFLEYPVSPIAEN